MTAYFRARRTAAGFQVEGTPSCELGHRLPDGDGIFAAWTWDGERLTVTNDRYGFYPLFYCERDGEIMVSPSLVELVRRGAPTELDEVALAVFRSLYFSFFIGEDTPFLAIKVVPPAARFEWDGRLAVEERGPRPIGTHREIAREEALREYADLLRDAVRRHVGEVDRFCTTLSGGRDSRQLLLALCELGRPPAFCATLAYKFPPIENNDLEIARALAERLGIPHRVIPQPPRLEAELRKQEACHFLTDDTAWYLAVGDYLRHTGLPALDGLGGDVFTAPWYQPRDRLDLYRAGRLEELACALLWRPDVGVRSDSPFLRSEEVRVLARERIVRELALYVDAPNPLSAFAFWNKLRRENALLPFGICAGVTCLCPYLDHRLFDFAASLPPELTLGGRFHTDVIAAAYPELADFPYATLGRGRRLRASASLAAHVGWYGARTDARRLAGWASAVARMALDNLSPAYHARHEVDGSEWLLYRWMLEDLQRGSLSAPS